MDNKIDNKPTTIVGRYLALVSWSAGRPFPHQQSPPAQYVQDLLCRPQRIIHWSNSTAVQLVQRHSSTVQWYSGTAVRRYGGTGVRRYGQPVVQVPAAAEHFSIQVSTPPSSSFHSSPKIRARLRNHTEADRPQTHRHPDTTSHRPRYRYRQPFLSILFFPAPCFPARTPPNLGPTLSTTRIPRTR